MRVTVMGTGAIGSGIARACLRAGHAVTVWNRTAARARPLAADGARVETEPDAAVRTAEVVVVVVFDTDAVTDVLDRIGDAVAPDGVVVLCSTVGADIDAVAAAAAERGIRLVDAPVLGNPGPAERGELSVMAACDPALRPRVAPVLDAIAARITWVADVPGPASRLKLACNTWVYGLNTAMAQALAVADGQGVDPQRVVDVVAGSAADSPFLGLKAPVALGVDDTVVSRIDAIRKDLGLIDDATRRAGLPTDLLDAMRGLYDRASADGGGAEDMARVTEVLRRATPPLRGIHHVKIPVSDLDASERFYCAVLGARRLREDDHVDADGRLYACILVVPGLDGLLELRHDAAHAASAAGFDPITLAVDDRAALARWRKHLDGLGIAHSGEITALQAWVTVVADPDGIRLRLYTLQSHGPELPADVDDPWLSTA